MSNVENVHLTKEGLEDFYKAANNSYSYSRALLNTNPTLRDDFVAACQDMYVQGQKIGRPELEVWYGPMPESNGKSNFTAILKRKDEGLLFGAHITIERSEYPDRVRYEADRVRHIIGELEEEPDLMDYDPDLHSGYKKKYDEVKAHYYAECRDMFPRNSEAWNAINEKLLAMFEGL